MLSCLTSVCQQWPQLQQAHQCKWWEQQSWPPRDILLWLSQDGWPQPVPQSADPGDNQSGITATYRGPGILSQTLWALDMWMWNTGLFVFYYQRFIWYDAKLWFYLFISSLPVFTPEGTIGLPSVRPSVHPSVW